MITCTVEDLGMFRPAIVTITEQLMARQPAYDKLALGRDDYESILMAKAWEGLLKWRSDPSRVAQGREAETKYVHKILWTRAAYTRRMRRRQNTDANLVSMGDCDAIFVLTGAEDGFLLRRTIQQAVDQCTPPEWDALCRYLRTGRKGPHARGRRSLIRAKNKMSDILERSLRSL
jgi:hypothetical protein